MGYHQQYYGDKCIPDSPAPKRRGFTIHPEQKPSDSEDAFAARFARETQERAEAALVSCKTHLENVRVDIALTKTKGTR